MMTKENYSENTIQVGDVRMSYYDVGTGDQVLVLVHAFPLTKEMWLPQLSLGDNNLRVIAPDLRGFGNSSAGEKEFSIHQFADDLKALLGLLKIKNAILCGLSLGGYVALYAAVHDADTYSSFIFCSTQCTADSVETINKRKEQQQKIAMEGLADFAESFVESTLAKKSVKTIRENVLTLININTPQEVGKTLNAMARRKETCSGLKYVRKHVLIIHGKDDEVIPFTQGEHMQQGLQQSSIKLMEGVGHFCNLENPGVFNKVIADYMQLLKV